MRNVLRWTLLALTWSPLLPSPARAGDEAWCADQGVLAEREAGVPAGLLLAIGRVESGRWPWTINAAGSGRRFETLAAAASATRDLMQQGVASIDVGCFQVNLLAHPRAFSSLEEAFDPQANARYAARFLVGLQTRLGDWGAAVAAYHSATPERGGPYRDRVMAEWGQPSPAAPAPPPRPAQLRVVTWSAAEMAPSGNQVRIWGPSGSGASVIHIRAAPALPTIQAPRG